MVTLKDVDSMRDSPVKFEYKVTCKVSKLEIIWDLYWSLCEDGEYTALELMLINKMLTKAAIKSLEEGNTDAWYKTADSLAEFGASDTEPRAQFAILWEKVYGVYP